MSTEGEDQKRSNDASSVLRRYFDYLDHITVSTFDPDVNDDLCREYVRIVRHQTREGTKGGYLNRVRRGFRFFSWTMPRFAGLLAALMFFVLARGPVGAGAALGDLTGVAAFAFVIGFGAAIALVLSSFGSRLISSGRLERMKDIRLFNFGQIGKEIQTAKQSALDNATTDSHDEGPVNLLRLFMLTRLHFELIRALEIDYDIFADGVRRTDLRGGDEILRLALVASGTAFAASVILPAPGTAWTLVTGAVVSGTLAYAALYGILRPWVLSALKEQKVLFRPQMSEQDLAKLRVPALRAREFNWQKGSETPEILSYVQWLEEELKEINERLKGPMVVRTAEAPGARTSLLPIADDQD